MKNLPLRISICRIGEPTLNEYAAARLPVDNPSRAFEFWEAIVAADPSYERDKEHLVAILLTTKNIPIGYNTIAIGALAECISHPREIFRPCILASASGFILTHNHPSGDPAPSEADKRLTRRIREAAELLQIKFMDHVIVGNSLSYSPGYFSFRESGLL